MAGMATRRAATRHCTHAGRQESNTPKRGLSHRSRLLVALLLLTAGASLAPAGCSSSKKRGSSHRSRLLVALLLLTAGAPLAHVGCSSSSCCCCSRWMMLGATV